MLFHFDKSCNYSYICCMKLESHPQELTQVPFSKTECGVDFNINTDTHERLRVGCSKLASKTRPKSADYS